MVNDIQVHQFQEARLRRVALATSFNSHTDIITEPVRCKVHARRTNGRKMHEVDGVKGSKFFPLPFFWRDTITCVVHGYTFPTRAFLPLSSTKLLGRTRNLKPFLRHIDPIPPHCTFSIMHSTTSPPQAWILVAVVTLFAELVFQPGTLLSTETPLH